MLEDERNNDLGCVIRIMVSTEVVDVVGERVEDIFYHCFDRR